MASKKRRFRAIKTSKDNMIEEQAQQGTQGISQAPVVESGFPQAGRESLAGDTVNPNPQQVSVSGILQTQAPPNPLVIPTNLSPAPGVGQTQTHSQDIVQPTAIPAPESTSVPPQDIELQKKSKSWIILVVLFIVIATVGGALYYFRSKAVKQAPKEEKVLPTPTLAPVTPTVSPATGSANLKVDYLQYEIRVLNGSGIKGEASKVKDSLEEEEFVVKDIDNADSSDYEKTIVRAKKDVSKEYLDALKKLLGNTYVLDTEEELRESADVDVIIIIGSSKKP